jgi:hypothetical protein
MTAVLFKLVLMYSLSHIGLRHWWRQYARDVAYERKMLFTGWLIWPLLCVLVLLILRPAGQAMDAWDRRKRAKIHHRPVIRNVRGRCAIDVICA